MRKRGEVDGRKRAQMFRAFVEKQSMRYVARVCSVSPRCVKRSREVDLWDKRLEAIQEKARARADGAEAERLAGLVERVTGLREKVVSRLEGIVGSADLTVLDLDRIIRLEEYLRGHPDARREHVVDPIQFLIVAIREHDEKKREVPR